MQTANLAVGPATQLAGRSGRARVASTARRQNAVCYRWGRVGAYWWSPAAAKIVSDNHGRILSMRLVGFGEVSSHCCGEAFTGPDRRSMACCRTVGKPRHDWIGSVRVPLLLLLITSCNPHSDAFHDANVVVIDISCQPLIGRNVKAIPSRSRELEGDVREKAIEPYPRRKDSPAFQVVRLSGSHAVLVNEIETQAERARRQRCSPRAQ